MLGETSSETLTRAPSVLIVEDDVLLGQAISLCIEDAGYEIAGCVHSVEAALDSLNSLTFDAALLDVRLQGEMVFPVADALLRKGVPFAFLTAQPRSELPEPFRNCPMVSKPYRDDALQATLASLLEKAASNV